MEIIILPTAEEAVRETARRVIETVRRIPETVLGLATGRTMEGVYRLLVEAHRTGGIDFSRVTTFNLDEYLGPRSDDPRTFRNYMCRHLFDFIGQSPERRFIPDSRPRDIEEECRRYEDAIAAAGGIDLQLLGIGREGHIGFNEPSSSLGARTRVKTLTDTTVRDNFGKETGVRFAITMGVGTIMEAREILLVALGKGKARAIAEAAEGPVTSACPASALQFHPRAKIIIDEEAAGRLERADYYRWVYAHKREAEAIGGEEKTGS